MLVTKKLLDRIEALESCVEPYNFMEHYGLFNFKNTISSRSIKRVESKLNRVMEYLGIEEVRLPEETKIQKIKKGK